MLPLHRIHIELLHIVRLENSAFLSTFCFLSHQLYQNAAKENSRGREQCCGIRQGQEKPQNGILAPKTQRWASSEVDDQQGCVGLPNVGKSSLFNLLTEQSAAAENYPFCTIEPNEARCAVPDEHYDFLCDLWKYALS